MNAQPEKPLFIPVILGTPRQGRYSEHVARFVTGEMARLPGVETELVEVRDLPIPVTGAGEDIKNPAFSELCMRADAFILVAPEYNHGYPGLLKHVLDTNLKEYIHKAVGICGVSAGGFGGTRVIQNMLPVMRELGLVTIFWDGNFSSSGPFGPYVGWDPRAVADGSDGLTRVLWTNADGSAALWLVGPEGNQASYRIGPLGGWTAVDVAASIPGSTRLLWTDVEGRVALVTVGNEGDVSMGRSHGPYPGWTAVAIADGQDGLTRMLSRRSDGSAGLSFFGSEGLLASYRLGGAAGWTATDVAVGADGQSRILWTHRGGRIALWRVDGDGNPTALGPIYAPPSGYWASRIAAGSDGLTRVLWTNPSGSAVLWTMSADNVFLNSFSPGPDGAPASAERGR